jgi:hypothetical protein
MLAKAQAIANYFAAQTKERQQSETSGINEATKCCSRVLGDGF